MVNLFPIQIQFLADSSIGAIQKNLLNEVNQLVITTIKKLQGASGNQRINLKQHIKKSIETLLYTRTKRRPMILPIIIEI